MLPAMGESDLTQALADIEAMLVDGEFALLGYERGAAPPSPPSLTAESFAVRIDDPFETTLLVRDAIADELPEPAVRTSPLRVIVLTATLDPGLTGFFSTIAGAFAERGIPIVPIGATTRDHLVVPAAHWPEALAILRGLRDAARSLRPPPSGE
jgi:hypothetical protein